MGDLLHVRMTERDTLDGLRNFLVSTCFISYLREPLAKLGTLHSIMHMTVVLRRRPGSTPGAAMKQ